MGDVSIFGAQPIDATLWDVQLRKFVPHDTDNSASPWKAGIILGGVEGHAGRRRCTLARWETIQQAPP